MSITASTAVLLLVGIILFVGGFVNGAAGFGYGLVSMPSLAVVLDPQTAVVLMIIPLIAAEIGLVRELGREGLRRCSRRFWPFILAAAGGTMLGMALLPWIPARTLTLVIGIVVLARVLTKQKGISDLISRLKRGSTSSILTGKVAMAGIGLVGGIAFGGASLGILMVSYLDGLDLDRSTFVGVIAMIFLGISTLRVGAAWVLGLYGSTALLWLSAGGAVPGLLGVACGEQVRHRLPERYVEAGVYGLLTLIGIQLTLSGLGVL